MGAPHEIWNRLYALLKKLSLLIIKLGKNKRCDISQRLFKLINRIL